jgi:c-di-GMP-binding flagellar brake protein YcgR
MLDLENITGQSIRRLLETLVTEKTLVRLRLRRSNYERLTMITGFRRKLNGSYFLADLPEGFKETVKNRKDQPLDFEFTGSEGIQYAFSTRGGEIRGDQICVEFPEYIRRHQRRKHFRLEAPDGSMVEFTFQHTECCERVVDVSEGGALIALMCFEPARREKLPFQVGDALEDIEMTFPPELGGSRVKIRKAAVVRFDNGMSRTGTCCGLQFIEIDQDQLKALTEFIYTCQREYLRKRLRPNR